MTMSLCTTSFIILIFIKVSYPPYVNIGVTMYAIFALVKAINKMNEYSWGCMYPERVKFCGNIGWFALAGLLNDLINRQIYATIYNIYTYFILQPSIIITTMSLFQTYHNLRYIMCTN